MPNFCREACSLVFPGHSSLTCHLVSAVPSQPLDAGDNDVLITQDSPSSASAYNQALFVSGIQFPLIKTWEIQKDLEVGSLFYFT